MHVCVCVYVCAEEWVFSVSCCGQGTKEFLSFHNLEAVFGGAAGHSVPCRTGY